MGWIYRLQLVPAHCTQACRDTKNELSAAATAAVAAAAAVNVLLVAVYSVGLYVDGHGAKKALHKYKGNDVDLIMDTQQVFDGGWG